MSFDNSQYLDPKVYKWFIPVFDYAVCLNPREAHARERVKNGSRGLRSCLDSCNVGGI